MKGLLLLSALALGVSGALAQDAPLSTLDMSSGNWISKTDFKDYLANEFEGYSDDAQIKFTWTVTTTSGEQGAFNGWGLGAIRDIGGTNNGLELTKAAEGDNTLLLTRRDIKSLLAIEDQYGRYGLNWNVWQLSKGDDQVTAITVARKSCTIAEVATTALRPVEANSEVVKTEYYNLAGVRSAEPSKGMNVVVRTMSNGTTQVDKQLVK